MASITHHHNKKTGTTYVYSVTSYWDKEKKAPRNRQVCIGKLDKTTGTVIPTRPKKKIVEPVTDTSEGTPSVRVVGPFLLLQKLSEELGLSQMLKQCFPDQHETVMSLVHFIAHKGLPLSRCEIWSKGHQHPLGDVIRSQRISELLDQLREEDRLKFLSLWIAKMASQDYLCYDITSVSSYSEANEYAKFGYNRDGESLPQINLAMLFGQKSQLPAYYRRMQGNISDVATLKTTVKSLDFLGANPMHLVLDRGFYSESNIQELFAKHHHFTIAVPSGRKWVQDIMDSHYETITSPCNYRPIDDSEALHVATELRYWDGKNSGGKKRSYLHVYYNAQQAAAEFDRFTRQLLAYKQEVQTGQRKKDHEESYARFLTIRETPKRGLSVSFNDEEIQKYRKRYAGFFCILSSKLKDPMEALRVYRQKDAVENSFDDLKNALDMKRLRIHSSRAMDSRLFLQFLALILISKIRNAIREDSVLKNLAVREVLEEMQTLSQITYSNRRGQIYTEVSPIQRKIMELFKLSLAA